ncbi:radical SAM protein [Selenomonadales bacterium OttesenSCG-928-I06]|nr:radical SAM protein [Selenomonadales bacterium OttesenSCG-928-I06]
MNLYFDNAEGLIFRPPSEATSFILRVTTGCSHNKCTYCIAYRSVKFRIRPTEEIMAQINAAKPYAPYIRRIFLADGNALVLDTDKLLAILAEIRNAFPGLQRVSCYAGPQDVLRKTPAQLESLKNAGLKMIYYGLESGDDTILNRICKGVSAAETIEAGQKVVASGIKLSAMIIAGIGGKEHWENHANNTALAVNAIKPNMLSALTLMLHRGSEITNEYESGEFVPLSPFEIMNEMHLLISSIDLPPQKSCIFRSNHVSNHISLAATLPKDKERLLDDISVARNKLSRYTNWDPYNDTGFF